MVSLTKLKAKIQKCGAEVNSYLSKYHLWHVCQISILITGTIFSELNGYIFGIYYVPRSVESTHLNISPVRVSLTIKITRYFVNE